MTLRRGLPAAQLVAGRVRMTPGAKLQAKVDGLMTSEVWVRSRDLPQLGAALRTLPSSAVTYSILLYSADNI